MLYSIELGTHKMNVKNMYGRQVITEMQTFNVPTCGITKKWQQKSFWKKTTVSRMQPRWHDPWHMWVQLVRSSWFNENNHTIVIVCMTWDRETWPQHQDTQGTFLCLGSVSIIKTCNILSLWHSYDLLILRKMPTFKKHLCAHILHTRLHSLMMTGISDRHLTTVWSLRHWTRLN